MPDFSSTEYQSALIKQFSESLQATAALTQSVQDLHSEVREHSELLTKLKVEIIGLKDQLVSLAKLVQGDGFNTSLTTAVVELRTKIDALDEWKKDTIGTEKYKKTNNLTVIIAIVTVIATFIGAGVSALIPLLFKG